MAQQALGDTPTFSEFARPMLDVIHAGRPRMHSHGDGSDAVLMARRHDAAAPGADHARLDTAACRPCGSQENHHDHRA